MVNYAVLVQNKASCPIVRR